MWQWQENVRTAKAFGKYWLLFFFSSKTDQLLNGLEALSFVSLKTTWHLICAPKSRMSPQTPSKNDCSYCHSTSVLTLRIWTNSRKEVPDILRSERGWRVVLVFCHLANWEICWLLWASLSKTGCPNPRLKLVSAVWLHWRWVVLQKWVDSKAWTCMHISQRYAFTDQPYKWGKCPYLSTNTSCFWTDSSLSSRLMFTGLLASHLKRMASQCRSPLKTLPCVFLDNILVLAVRSCVSACSWPLHLYCTRVKASTWNQLSSG